jgi:hypothetical protein
MFKCQILQMTTIPLAIVLFLAAAQSAGNLVWRRPAASVQVAATP